MITRAQFDEAIRQATELFQRTGVSIRDDEYARMEVADFGLGEVGETGAQIITLIDTEQVAAKLIALLPNQTLPEHRHPRLGDYAGKAETVRCEWGVLFVCVPGEVTQNPQAHPPQHRRHTYTVWQEHVLHPGQQVTLEPNTLHWFQGGPEGAVAWSISTKAVDVQDIFTDPEISRTTQIAD